MCSRCSASHLADLGTTIFDAETLERVKTALAAIESMASKQAVPADQLLEFVSENLLGVAPDLLGEANAHVRTALAVLDPFSRASLEARIAAARDAAATAFKNARRCAGRRSIPATLRPMRRSRRCCRRSAPHWMRRSRRSKRSTPR